MSEIRIGAPVRGTDGTFGHLRQLIVDATTTRVLHVVVGEGGFGGHHRVVPISAVSATTHALLELDLDREGLRALPTVDGRESEHLLDPADRPDIGRPEENGDLPLLVLAADLPVVDVTGTEVGTVDEWWVSATDLGRITNLVLVRSGGLRLDRFVVVPVSHLFLDPTPRVALTLTEVDLAALPHEPILPGVHLDAVQAEIDVSEWTPREPDEAAGLRDPDAPL